MTDLELQELLEHIKYLEKRIEELEAITNHLRPE